MRFAVGLVCGEGLGERFSLQLVGEVWLLLQDRER